MLLRVLAEVDLGIGILNMFMAAACFCCSFDNAAAAWAIAAVCAAVKPGMVVPDARLPSPRLGDLAATACIAAAICAMLLAFIADDVEFPPLKAADNVFCAPKRARLGFDTGDVVAGFGIGFIIGLGDKCGWPILFKDGTGAFIEFCSFNFVRSPVLDETAEKQTKVFIRR